MENAVGILAFYAGTVPTPKLRPPLYQCKASTRLQTHMDEFRLLDSRHGPLKPNSHGRVSVQDKKAERLLGYYRFTSRPPSIFCGLVYPLAYMGYFSQRPALASYADAYIYYPLGCICLIDMLWCTNYCPIGHISQ